VYVMDTIKSYRGVPASGWWNWSYRISRSLDQIPSFQKQKKKQIEFYRIQECLHEMVHIFSILNWFLHHSVNGKQFFFL